MSADEAQAPRVLVLPVTGLLGSGKTMLVDAEDIRSTFATFRIDAGRAARNMTINPAAYARFRDTIALFRTSPRCKPPPSSAHQKRQSSSYDNNSRSSV